ncbi:MAG: hypothetical protein ACOCRX_09590, partial [Candidatus Woesearchaeota archaeon]
YFLIMKKIESINFTNLINSVYIAKKRTSVSQDLSIQDQIDKNLQNLGLKEVRKQFSKDTYYGLVTDYSWHNLSSKSGAQFSPLNYLIDEIEKINLQDKVKLDSMKRRLNYLILLRDEIQYIFSRYDFNRLPIMQDWLLNKFERYATLVAELSLFIIEYYNIKINNLSEEKSIRFENMIEYIYNIDKLFQYLNSTVNGFVIINLRNHIVHSEGFELELIQDDFLIKIPEITINLKFGILENYAKDVIELFFNGKKKYGTDITITDPRFSHLTLIYKVTKKGTIDYPKTKIKVDISIKEYIKIAEGFIFLLARTLLQKVLSESTP